MKTSLTRELALPTLVVLSGAVVAAVAAFLTRLVMARSLSPDELGDLLVAIAVASTLGGIASAGIHLAATQRLATASAKGSGDAAAIARTAVAVGVGAGVLATLVCLLLAHPLGRLWDQPGMVRPLLWCSPVAGLIPIGLAVLGIARAHDDLVGRAVVRDGGGGLARLALVAAVAATGGAAPAQAAAFTAGVGVGELGYLLHGVRRGWLAGGRPGWDAELVRGLRPFALLAVLSQAVQWLDLLLLGALASAVQVGLYGVARSAVRFAGLVGEAAAHRFLPRAAEVLAGGSGEQLGRLYGSARSVVLVLVGPPAAVALVVPQELLGVLFGESYVAGAPALRVLALVMVAVAAVGVPDRLLIAAGRADAVTRTRLLAAALGIAVGWGTIPHLGALGAALAWGAMAVTEAVVLLVWLWQRYRIRLPLRETLGLLTLTVGLPAAVGAVARSRELGELPVLLLVIGTAAAGALVVLSGLVRAEE